MDLQNITVYERVRTEVVARPTVDSFLHCCTQRTASQWIKGIFLDPRIWPYSGMQLLAYNKMGLRATPLPAGIPAGTIALHLYTGYPAYRAMVRTPLHRTVFVLRDPRDIVVSWYFKVVHNRGRSWPLEPLRRKWAALDQVDGLAQAIRFLDQVGLFDAQRSWVMAQDPAVRILRYEALATDPGRFLDALLDHGGFPVPEAVRVAVLDQHRFELHAGGRTRGEEDREHHYRRGVAGEGQELLTGPLADQFRTATGDLLEMLGYG